MVEAEKRGIWCGPGHRRAMAALVERDVLILTNREVMRRGALKPRMCDLGAVRLG